MGGNIRNGEHIHHDVNFSQPRSFGTILKSDLKETFFPDDPFRQFKGQPPLTQAKKALQYFIPIFQWLPKYTLSSFRYDLLAGITITSLAIPQGISYAKLANLPPIIGLYCSFVPPLVYAIFGSSKDLAVGNVAAASLLLAAEIQTIVDNKTDPDLYRNLIFTATFITGLYQAILGIFRLGILVDFLSHSVIVGFMGGTAVIICLQQLKGVLGLKKFTRETDVVSVLKSVFSQFHEWNWKTAVIGIIFLVFLLFTRHVKKKKPKLFWVNAIGPMVTVIVGCLFAYFAHAEKYGIATVGHLNKGLSPISIRLLNFDPKYLPAVAKAGIITGTLALAEGIAIARSFAMMKMEQIDGNKEMIAFGMMNIAGSFTSSYLTTGPFSKSAVNYNAGCKTAMSNIVMAFCMMLTLLFLAPLFSYTPLVSLSAIIMAAMLGLIDYEEAIRLFKVDKFDFVIAMSAFLGVAFLSMDVGLMISIGLSILRALLYVARPAVSNIKRIPNSTLYRDVQQYPSASGVPGILVLKLGSPIYFANSSYVKERITRYVEDEKSTEKDCDIEHVILDLGGVTSIDSTGIEMLYEVRRNAEKRGMKISISNPRIEVVEKLMLAKFINIIGKESVFISVDEAIEACRFNLNQSKQERRSSNVSNEVEDDTYIDDDKLSRCSSTSLSRRQ
ncbi:Sulfate transporter 3.1 [Thalictrum thalictroides]|uniref:Sulfate transporter 3.1 n=1 Tax=Thalictrum thalictroides TaxID=46969 RepID=A0A7J6W8K5_THATH|nr:Sulfate transporter 3.1 [Thalictrum thalictroides]